MDEQKKEMTLKEMGTNMLNSIKGPVFWLAIGYIACKLIDRKKVQVVK